MNKTKPVGDYSDRLFFSYSDSAPEFYCTYILQSTTTGQFYVGSCSHLLNAFYEHQSDSSKSTRGRGPWCLPYYELYDTFEEAQAREEEIKSKKSSKHIKTLIYAVYPLIELH